MTFVKGQSGNPNGRPRIVDSELQQVLESRKPKIKQYIDKYLWMTQAEMAAIGEPQTKNMPLIESWIIKIVEFGHNNQDVGLLMKLIECSCGRVDVPPQLTEEQRMALALYEQFTREHAARLNPPEAGGLPAVDREPD